MRIAVLLSASLHPVSGRPSLSKVEAQAVALALALGREVVGFHVGPETGAAQGALGHGLPLLVHIPAALGSDPVPPLAAELARFQPDLILAGPRSVGADETGLVPYRLAEALGWPILADAVAVERDGGEFVVCTALPKGERLSLREQGPLVLTLHPAAPPARPYAFGLERRGQIEMRKASPAGSLSEETIERPMRQRAKVKAGVTGASAADRLKAATEAAATQGGELLVDPDPEAAARAILEHLRAIGAVPPRSPEGSTASR